jgi:para-nitrobenzyl esterase
MARMTVVARTTLGDLRGAQGDGVVSFRNVPYAAPPLGPLRFSPPAPAAPWTGVRDATAHGPIGPQPPSRLRAAMGDFDRPQSEDCLTLTIATPGTDGARPVIVWLHGGAYMTGAGSLDWYDGATLARDRNVVVVGVNYRLGALGFLAHPAIGGGNYALFDMAAALAWVRDNISRFGGDPARVTVMGQSAGAHAIMCLLTMPDPGKLFRHAILMSAPPSLVPLQPAAATANAEHLFKLLDISPDASDAAARLRETPVEKLLAAQMSVTRAGARFADISPPFVPMIEGISTVEQFVAAAAKGAAAAGIDMVIGTTREEMHAFFAPDPAMANPPPEAVAERFSTLAGARDAIEKYRDRRPGASVAELLGDLVTDHMFLFPSLALADAATALGRRVFVYQFDWSAPGSRFGACHCIDLPFVFGNAIEWPGAAMLEGGDPAEIAGVSAAIGAAFAAFAHGGDPSCPALPWPTYQSARRMTMCYGPIIGIVGDPAGIAWRAGHPA